jgi:hypothetical protein
VLLVEVGCDGGEDARVELPARRHEPSETLRTAASYLEDTLALLFSFWMQTKYYD